MRLAKELKKKRAALIIGALSLATAYFAQYAMPNGARSYYTMNAAPLLVAVLFFFLYRKGYELIEDGMKKRKTELILTAILGLILATFVVEGAQLTSGVFFNPLAVPLLLSIVLCSLPMTIGLLFLWRGLEDEKATAGSEQESEAVDLKWFLGAFFAIMLCWIPWYLGSFPGLFCYNMGETNGEWGQYTTGALTTHFPVFHTLLSGMIVDFGRNAFGDGVSIDPGVALLTALQSIVIAAIFAYCVYWIRGRGASRIIAYGAIIYFALNPVTSTFVMCTTRDTLFSAIALLVAMFSYDALGEKRHGGFFKALIKLALACLLLCLLRNNGVYSFILLAVVLVSLAKKRIVVGGVCVLVVIVSLLWMGPGYEAFDVEQEENQQKEALALPIQQLAYVSSSGKLTDDEIVLLSNSGYSLPSAEDYFPKISDPSKFTIFDMDLGDLVGVYVSIGINHPIDYLYAEIARTQDLWSPYSYINCYNGFIDQAAGKETSFFSTTINSPGTAQPLIPGTLEFMHRLGGELFFQSIPLASLLVSLPFYFAVMLIVMFRAIMVRDSRAIGAMFALVALAIGAYFGPCVLPRYYMYLFFGLPLMVFLLVKLCRASRTNQ